MLRRGLLALAGSLLTAGTIGAGEPTPRTNDETAPAPCPCACESNGQLGENLAPIIVQGGELCRRNTLGPSWFVQKDVVILQRSTARNQVLAVNGAGQTALTAGDLQFDFEPGPRLSLGAPFGEQGSLDLTYFGIYDWQAGSTVFSPTGNLGVPFAAGMGAGPSAFESADSVRASYDSNLSNVELNYRRYLGPADHLSLLGGFRYVNLQENFNLQSTRTSVPSIGTYDVKSNNNLYGLQVGTNYGVQVRRFRLDAARAGLSLNDACQRSQVTDTAGTAAPLLRDTRGAAANTSFVGETGLTGFYRLTNHLWLHGGYQAMWLSSVALAPEQLDLSSRTLTGASSIGSGLNNNGDLFFHGAVAGAELRWGGGRNSP